MRKREQSDRGADSKSVSESDNAIPRMVGLLTTNEVIALGIQQILNEQEPNWYRVISMADTTSLTISLSAGMVFDRFLIDVSEMSTVDLRTHMRRIRSTSADAVFIAFSHHLNLKQVSEMMQIGVGGYMLDRHMASMLIHMLENVAENAVENEVNRHTILPPDVTSQLLEHTMQQSQSSLNRCDREVLRLMAEDMKVVAIARQLNVSRATVYRSRERLRAYLGVSNDETIVTAARRRGLLDNSSRHD